MLRELEQSLHIAMLFLKNVQKIEIRVAGQLVRTFQRVDEGNSLILSDGSPDNDQIWHIICGDFSQAADELRRRHPGRIEQKRSAKVTLAIPHGLADTGLLCACLPTEQDVGIPFHFNADFFPSSDRKRVIFAADYQSEWNREALRAGAKALADAVEELPNLLDPDRFWGLVSTLKEVSEKSQRGEHEPALAWFWREIASKLASSTVVYTTTGTWIKPAEAVLLGQPEEAKAIPVLEGLGIKLVHEILRPYYNVLRGQPLNIPLLNIERLCAVLASAGLTRRSAWAELPQCLMSMSGRRALVAEIVLLLEREHGSPRAKSEDERRLRGVAIAP